MVELFEDVGLPTVLDCFGLQFCHFLEQFFEAERFEVGGAELVVVVEYIFAFEEQAADCGEEF